MSTFTIDLCVGWAKVGEVVDGTLDAVVRNLTQGEYMLTGAVDSITLDGGSKLSDIDTIRVVRDADIVFPGYVAPVASGVGGLQIVKDPSGDKFTLTGPDAWSVLNSRVAYPTPSTGPPWVDGWDVRSGVASTVAAAYIMNNAGVFATADRQIAGLSVVDGAAGLSGTWSARLQPLDQLIARICNEGGITCRLGVDFAGALTAALRKPVDRRTSIILFDEGDLTAVQTVETPQAATFVVSGGQGTLTARTFATAGTATGAVRREVFSDQSSLSTSTEVQQSANATLAGAAPTLTVRAEIVDVAAQRLQYLIDYDIGDTIAAEIDRIRYPVVVESVTIHVGPDRAVIRPVLGAASPNLVTGLIRDVADLQSRFDTKIA